MFGKKFYHGSIRKYVTLVGTLFNDIEIDRRDSSNNVTQSIKVPISFGPKEKTLARLTQDPNLDRKFAISLPRISFELVNINYAPERKLLTINRNVNVSNTTSRSVVSQYNPVPYDFMFTVSVMCKNTEDATQIIEQVLPFFTPEWTPTVNLVPEMNIIRDIPVVMLDVVAQDIYEGNFEERRALVWTMNMIVKGYLFGPVSKTGVITLTDVNFFDASPYDDIDNAVGVAPVIADINITPGLDANGVGTTNSLLTVGRNSIAANSDYEYITTKVDY